MDADGYYTWYACVKQIGEDAGIEINKVEIIIKRKLKIQIKKNILKQIFIIAYCKVFVVVVVLSYIFTSLVPSGTISIRFRVVLGCLLRYPHTTMYDLHLQLFVERLMSSLHYLGLFAHSGFQHIYYVTFLFCILPSGFMLLISLHCTFLISPSISSTAYLRKYCYQ